MQSHAAGWSDADIECYEREGYWQRLTLGQHLHQWAQRYGGRVALVEGDSRCSYAELDQRADRLAAGFTVLGVQHGDCVLLQLPNSIAFVVSLFALMRVGALPLLAMPSQRLRDLEGLCAQALPVACIVPDRFLGFDHRSMAETLQARCPYLQHLIVDGDAGCHLTLEALEAAPLSLPSAPHPNSTALLLQSGGTTGTPKLIPRTHADYAYNAQASATLCGLTADSVYLAALPIAHNFPLACPGVLGTLFAGGRVVMAHTPSSDEAFSLIARERVNITALVPPLVQLWLHAREGDTSDLSSLQWLQVGGARLEPELARQITPVLGCRLQQVFGMAEGLLCYTRLNDPDEVVHHSQGRPLSPHDEVRIVDAQGIDVAPGETGELLTCGPYTIHSYYGATQDGSTAFTADGYYRSGDLVRRTLEGNLVVEGRLKEQINRAGEKIATAEIEQHLREHPAVQDAVVIALDDTDLGERSCAFIVAQGEAPSLRELHDFLRSRGLPRHKLPDQLEISVAWPLTNVGKIDKRRLAALARRAVDTKRAGMTLAPVTVISSDRFRYRIDDDLLLERAFGGLLGADIAAAGHTVDNTQLARALHVLRERHGEHLPVGCLQQLNGELREVGECYAQLAKQPASQRLSALAATVSTKAWEVDNAQIESLFHIFRHSLRAVACYPPEPFAGNLHLLHDDEELHFLPGLQPDMKTFWTGIALGDIRVERIEGNHLSCLQPPHVQAAVAHILREQA